MDEPIRFRFLDGGEGVMTRREMLFHVVNHATFHRGFAVDTLRRMSMAVPATDVTAYLGDRVRRQ
ncbi:DinB family protein [Burkholderia stagnalis]|uniref:DinB family protein n=1 Tax=Burkholderia stagnalis TaxID=1503054 RepID=UPI0009C174B2|nr:DinB family protein [Burkholderia stagnalis]